MPMRGFICPYNNTNVKFDYCYNGCPISCISQPLLSALIKEPRENDGIFHVTELATPEQIVYLKRKHDYWVSPFSLIWLVLGEAAHTIIESQADKLDKDRYVIEEPFEVDFGYAKVRGRADIFDKHARVLYDYKTMKGYKAKRLLEGEWDEEPYMWQLNFYKILKFHDAKELMIEAIIKDWSMNMLQEMNIHPIERIPVPMLPQGQAEDRLQYWLQRHTSNAKEDTVPKLCTQEDVWYNTNPRSRNCGVPLRCRDYCEVNVVCPQYASFMETEDAKQGAKVYPKR